MKLRKWVQYLLIGIITLCFFTLGSECDDTFVFITSHIMALIVSMFCAFVLEKYGTLN